MDWYNQVYVRFEMIKLLRQKYLTIMYYDEKLKRYCPRRYWYGYNFDMFATAIEKNQPINEKKLYADLDYWRYMIAFSWNPEEREKQKVEWDKIKDNEIIGRDFAIDFDSQNWKNSHRDCKRVMKYMDELEIPYSVCWSGKKGFHLRILDDWLPRWKPTTKIERSNLLVQYLKEKLNLKTIDEGIYNITRILKLPYSIDGSTGLVVLPLTNDQFYNFYPEMCTPERVLKEVKVKNRGLLTREGTKQSVQELFREAI